MMVYEKPAEYRGTIEVNLASRTEARWPHYRVTTWLWKCKPRDGKALGSGGADTQDEALNAINAQYAARLSPNIPGIENGVDIRDYVVPWRLVIHDRHGNIERIGAVY